MKNICKENRFADKHIQQGLCILAKIIIRKCMNENMEKEGDGEIERDYSRKTISNK